jgi:hypothetical protein
MQGVGGRGSAQRPAALRFLVTAAFCPAVFRFLVAASR